MAKRLKNRYGTLTYADARNLRALGWSMQDIAGRYGYDRAYLIGWYAGKTAAVNRRQKMIREAEMLDAYPIAKPEPKVPDNWTSEITEPVMPGAAAVHSSDGFWTAKFTVAPTCEPSGVSGSAAAPVTSEDPRPIDATVLSLIWTGYLQRAAKLKDGQYLSVGHVEEMLWYAEQTRKPAS